MCIRDRFVHPRPHPSTMFLPKAEQSGFLKCSDHITHIVPVSYTHLLQMAGNKPIALIGGGTTMIGDPSGRTDMRKMLTKEDIAHNAACCLPSAGASSGSGP